MKPVPARLTTGQIARLSSVHINVVKKWIGEGLLTAYRLPAGHFRIEKEEYLRFLDKTGMPLPDELRNSGQQRILIIDDDPTQLELVEQFLALLGYPTQRATDGHLGLIQIGAFEPDLVLLDINMPRANGFDLLEALKKRPSNPEIIIITGEQGPELTSRLASYVVRGILHKPFSLNDLQRALEFLRPEGH